MKFAPFSWLRGLWRASAGASADGSANAILPGGGVVVALVAMAPLALLLAGVAPRLWVVAPAVGGVLLVLALLDGWLAGRLLDVRLLAPVEVEVGAMATLTVLVDLARGARAGHAVLALDERLAPGGRFALALACDAGNDTLVGMAPFAASQRCAGQITRLWLRWPGPLGLGWRHHSRPVTAAVRVTPNLSLLRSPAIQTLVRDAELGLINRRLRGEGTLFETMAQYQPGMDRRRIDWKVTARHAALYAREYEAERNNRIVFALDCGHGMCEPVAGEARLDRAVSAALATAWVALKTGDQCALFGFDARVRLATPFVTGAGGFARLRSAATNLDYSAREPNFTLALAALAARLERRALIVVFSDFTDPTSAALMVESVGRLIKRHRVLFVTMQDEELETAASAHPADPQALATAVSAGALLDARALVLARLRALGVAVIEAPYDAIGPQLIDSYLEMRQRGGIG